LLTQDLALGEESGDKNSVFAGIENIGLDSKENIYILDRKNFRIQKFSPVGGFLSSIIIGKGQGPDEVSSILAIAVTESGGIYAVDRNGGKILVIDEEGNFTRSFSLEFSAISIVPYSSKRLVILGLYKNLIFHVFSPEGVYLESFGEPFEVPAQYAIYKNLPQIRMPRRADYSRDESVLLMNPHEYEIMVYKEGKMKGIIRHKSDSFRPLAIKQQAEGRIGMVFPWVSVLKHQNRIYVSIDDLNKDTPNQMDIFEDGRYVSSFKVEGFAYAIDKEGRIYCAEEENIPRVVRYFIKENR
jgi:outer membrane protein assembly factor BamB